jgi:hypothetical protein
MYYTSPSHVRMFVTSQYINLFVYFYIHLLAIWTLVLIIFAQFLYRYGISALLKEITLSFYLYAIYLRLADLTHIFLCLHFRFFSSTYSLIHDSINWIGGSHFFEWNWIGRFEVISLLARLKSKTANCTKILIPSYQHTLCSFSENMNLVNLNFFFWTHLLTYSIEQISFWEANRFSGRTFRLKFTNVYSGHRICL